MWVSVVYWCFQIVVLVTIGCGVSITPSNIEILLSKNLHRGWNVHLKKVISDGKMCYWHKDSYSFLSLGLVVYKLISMPHGRLNVIRADRGSH